MVGIVRFASAAFLLFLATAAMAAPVTVVFPESGTYVVWAHSSVNAVTQESTTVTGKSFQLSPQAGPGDELFVLDRHDGFLATQAIPAGAEKVTLKTGDFAPMAGPATQVAPPAGSAPAPAPVAPSEPEPSVASGFERLFGLLFGIAVTCGVVWIVLQLTKTRGKPLVELARRAGVDVPDPDDPIPLAPTAAVPAFKPRPPVEKIPDEATRPPIIPAARLGSRPSTLTARRGGPQQLVGYEGIAAGTIFKLGTGTITIGRDAGCDLVITDSTVSRTHARIFADEGGTLTIEDAGSANGVIINGLRVDTATLALDDEIKIGDNYFRLEEA